MITITNVETYGWEAAIRGMRNPMNSWDKCDSYFGDPYLEDENTYIKSHIGPKDLDLMTKLVKAGTDHRKFMRMITVYCDITAPLYWWKEFDTYKVGTVANSCSTMHKIQAKRFKREDFSIEHLSNTLDKPDPKIDMENHHFMVMMDNVISCLNVARDRYLETKDKNYWWQMIQLLPSSYNQKRTVMLNYEVLSNIYKSRKGHKLDEWHALCDWIEELPYSELITGDNQNENHIDLYLC